MNRAALIRCLLPIAIALAASAMVACSHDEPTARTAFASSSGPGSTSSREGMGATMAQPPSIIPTAETTYGPQSPMVPGAWGLPPDLTGLDDGQLAGIVQAIHQADIEHLQLALTRSSTAELLSFARDGIQMHRTAAGQDDADLAQMRITPAVSSTSQQVLADWQRDQAELQVVQPGEFDRAFINHHVTRDTRALALLDAAIDRVRSQTLKGHLLTDRVAIAGHLREAQRVQMLLRPPRP